MAEGEREGEKERGKWEEGGREEGGQQGSCSLLSSLCCGSLGSLGCEERMHFQSLSVHVQPASLPAHLNSHLNSNLSRKTQTKILLLHMILPFCGSVTMFTESTEPKPSTSDEYPSYRREGDVAKNMTSESGRESAPDVLTGQESGKLAWTLLPSQAYSVRFQ